MTDLEFQPESVLIFIIRKTSTSHCELKKIEIPPDRLKDTLYLKIILFYMGTIYGQEKKRQDY